MNDMKIRDDKEMEAPVVDGNGTETGHIIVTTIGGRNGQSKQTISYMAERVVGHGSFGVVFQILADAMGLGKTVMTIALILGNLGRGSSGDRRVTANNDDDNDDGKKARRKDPQVKSRPTVKGGTLIICPMTLLGQWKELKNLRPQLYSAAEYCEKSYLHSEQKHM